MLRYNSPALTRRISALLVLFVTVMPTGLMAQTSLPPELPQEALTLPLDEDVPLTPAVITGQFDNGLSYFIRRNQEPANRAELRLVVDAGSILEDESQLGLAHFLEHMAFNGTENFNKFQIVEYMESIGMRFGAEVNASTSFDETIYKLQVPTNVDGNMETAFDILADWSSALTLDPLEIERERGVVIEEWRLSQGAQRRVTERLLDSVVKGSRYADRLPIGTLESLQTFAHEDLRRFYEDWYRPDLMAVIAVGDFDPAYVETLIRERFEVLPAPVNPRVRTNFGVPVQAGNEYLIVTDPEIPIVQMSVYHKQQAEYDWTANGYRKYLIEQLFDGMLNARFAEVSRSPDSPFLQAQGGSGKLVRALTTYQLNAAVQENSIGQGLAGLITEAERVQRFGFTQPELDRQKMALARGVQQYYDNRNSRNSVSMVEELTRAFLTGESVPGEPMEYALTLRFLGDIALDEVNALADDYYDEADRLVFIVAPQKQDLAIPSEESLDGVFARVASAEIEPYEEASNDAPLVAEVPEGSPVVETRELDGGITEWTLGNGVTVVLKPTGFSEDQVLFSAFSPGGSSLVSDADYPMADTTVSVIAGGGLGEFTAIDLQRKLTGKVASVVPVISDYEEGLSGGASPSDLDTLFQLIYLRMTNPRADQDYFQVLRNQIGTVLQNRSADPGAEFNDTLQLELYDDHPRKQPPSLALLDQLDLDRSLAFYQDRLGDATDFTFVFVGKFEPEAIRPLVETWIGGLPVSGKDEDWRDVGVRFATGVQEETVRRGLEQQSRTNFVFTGDFAADDQRERLVLTVMTQVLQSRLLNVMREELGGTYGVSVNPDVNRLPVPAYSISVSFASDPGRVDELVAVMLDQIRKLQIEGPRPDEMADKKLALMKQQETRLEQNGFWMGRISDAYRNGEDPMDSIESFGDSVESITELDVQRAANEYLDEGNYVRVTLVPEV